MLFGKSEICSLKTSQALKRIGFDKIVGQLYCTDIRHNGKSIDFETELDLKAEGRESEIEEVPFGKLLFMTNTNNELGDHECSAPLMYEAVYMFKMKYNMYFSLEPIYSKKTGKTSFYVGVYYFNQEYQNFDKLLIVHEFDTYEDAYDNAILKAAEYIESKNNK